MVRLYIRSAPSRAVVYSRIVMAPTVCDSSRKCSQSNDTQDVMLPTSTAVYGLSSCLTRINCHSRVLELLERWNKRLHGISCDPSKQEAPAYLYNEFTNRESRTSRSLCLPSQRTQKILAFLLLLCASQTLSFTRKMVTT